MKNADASNGLRCAISGASLTRREAVPIALVRPELAAHIRKEHPELQPDAVISRATLDQYRGRMVEELLHEERGELTDLEKDVVASLASHDIISQDVESEADERRTFGERAADLVAQFGGSWSFIIAFAAFAFIWMGINLVWASATFDPYPFILLNLVLSCLAAIQAPIIMMSQGRKEAKDRLRAQSDYRVNLKAELEIRHLHEKIDHMLLKQWDRLAEIQKIQLDLLQELAESRGMRKAPKPVESPPSST
ncbi:DUF1003 domain-containing protein [Terrarubrum flagellatum]|uniref:DUF1003 domain-containing protein n=1 Tax=Terrirubrum flagellatum TaxID=2895980 RepID=UPI0031455D37